MIRMYYTRIADLVLTETVLISYDPNCIQKFGSFTYGKESPNEPLRDRFLMFAIERRIDQEVELLPSNVHKAFEEDIETPKVQPL